MNDQNPIEQDADEVVRKIKELVQNKFTGSVTVNYNFLQGRMMGVELTTKQSMSAKVINNLTVLNGENIM